MNAPQTSFVDTRRRPRWWVMALVALGHLLAFYGLVRAFAPDAVASVERSVLSTFNVTITAPPSPPPPAEPEPDEGAAGEQGKQAVPKPVTAPTPKVPVERKTPVPRASSTGSASTSGARDSGAGTGASGSGLGTGSGRGGGGQGGGVATKPVLIAGNITNADVRLFPVPPGGRESRFGQEVIVYVDVDTEGRPSRCRVTKASNDPVADSLVCELVVERLRFEPARDAQGNAVRSTFGWRQRFFER